MFEDFKKVIVLWWQQTYPFNLNGLIVDYLRNFVYKLAFENVCLGMNLTKSIEYKQNKAFKRVLSYLNDCIFHRFDVWPKCLYFLEMNLLEWLI